MTIPAHIQTWIDALRSGEYQQCKNRLVWRQSYCCLGVYAEVNGIEIPHRRSSIKTELLGNSAVYDQIADLVGNTVLLRGINMNDAGHSFAEIADMIEREYSNA